MENFEISATGKIECMELFSKGITYGKNYIYGGFFWPADNKLSIGLSLILYKLIKEKSKSDLDLEGLKKEFSNLIRHTDYQPSGKAIYRLNDVIWYSPRKLFKKDKEASFERYSKNMFFRIVSGKVSTPSQADKRAGLSFLRIIKPTSIEDNKLSRGNIWELRKKILKIWKDLTDNQQVKSYLDDILVLFSIIEEDLGSGAIENYLIIKLSGYVAPFDFDNFESAVLLSRARLFQRIKKPEELIQDIISKDKSLWEDLEYAIKQRGLKKSWLKDLLYKAYDEDFLKILRTDWKEVLKKLLSNGGDFLGAFIVRDSGIEGKLSYGTYYVPNEEIEIFVFYEKSLEGFLNDFKMGFEKAAEDASKKNYTGGVSLKINKTIEISKLIPDFEELKKIDFSKGILEIEESEKLLFNLFYFIARLKSFVEFSKKEGKPIALLLLLDTDIKEENGKYPFWDYFAIAYDFFSLPIQTLNKSTIKSFIKCKDRNNFKDIQGIYKNLFISLLKDLKSLEIKFEDFKVSDNSKIHVVIEKPSAGFCYERFNPNQTPIKHYLYEAYIIHIEKDKLSIEIEDKFIVLAGGVNFEKDRIKRWIEEKISTDHFYFISTKKIENSFIGDIINSSSLSNKIKERSLFVEYDELATAYLSEKVHSDCLVIHTSEFSKLKEKLKLNEQNHKISIAIKPSEPKSEKFNVLDGERFYHSSIQIFSTNSPGWEKDEIYMEKKNTFLLTILALSQYESESFQTPYAKIEMWQKRKNTYLKLRRNDGEYIIGLSGLLYEILYLASKIPVGEKDLKDNKIASSE